VCYSAQVQADYKKYVVMFGATMSIRDFYEIFYRRGLDPRIKIPKAVEASFRDPQRWYGHLPPAEPARRRRGA
jgi:hypothetical protein